MAFQITLNEETARWFGAGTAMDLAHLKVFHERKRKASDSWTVFVM